MKVLLISSTLLVPGALAALLAWFGWRLSTRRALPAPAGGPGVSILKPLMGVDPALEHNLATFFRLDYPDYEIVLGAADPLDPALEVAARVAAAHPRVPCRIVHGERFPGGNPKVSNLANLLRHARHDVLWVSDGNTAVHPAHLSDMVARLGDGTDGPVGLVSSPVSAEGGVGTGAALESLQLHTFVRGGVGALHAVGGVCVVGKSMLFRRRDLARIGGLRHLAGFVAEDQVCGEEIRARGLRCTLGAHPVRNVLGHLTVADFAARHLRWARLRRNICPAGYAGEILLQPVAWTAAVALLAPSSLTAGLLAAAYGLRVTCDIIADRSAGRWRPLAVYLVLSPARDLLVAALWPVPWFQGGEVRWRGHRIRIGPRTRILDPDGNPMALPHPAQTGAWTVQGDAVRRVGEERVRST